MGDFRFRQFSLRDDLSAMKVGTDAVLLGAWTDLTNATNILDIGTGCGIIALMLAQRTDEIVKITGIDIHAGDIEQSNRNANQSPWSKRIMFHHSSVQQFNPEEKFSHIVSNPPYFTASLLPPDVNRRKARHDTTLTHKELLMAVDRLLINVGKFSVILPATESLTFQSLALKFHLKPSRITRFFSREEKPEERTLMEFTRAVGHVVSNDLILYGKGDQWSDAYTNLTSEFYLPR